jgi:pimeloyl-ACP methyl ester carboxylesterase
VDRLFLPGFGAPAGLYRPALAAGWMALEPPPFRSTRGALASYRAWLEEELDRRVQPVWLAGHSMGGALAVLAAADRPERVARLTLISPAGLPLQKPMGASLADLGRQFAARSYAAADALAAVSRALAAPRSALRLAREVHGLDLSLEMERVRRSGVPVEVVACASDTLVTPSHCRRQAQLLGAQYRHLSLQGGHMWMLAAPDQLAAVLVSDNS